MCKLTEIKLDKWPSFKESWKNQFVSMKSKKVEEMEFKEPFSPKQVANLESLEPVSNTDQI